MTTDATTRHLHNLATFLINYRYGIVSLFVVITIGMMFAMSSLKIETGFKKQLPFEPRQPANMLVQLVPTRAAYLAGSRIKMASKTFPPWGSPKNLTWAPAGAGAGAGANAVAGAVAGAGAGAGAVAGAGAGAGAVRLDLCHRNNEITVVSGAPPP